MSDTTVDTGTGSKSTSTGPFEDPAVTVREHMDPDKHLIGEALMAPSIQEVSVQSGGSITTGKSNIVARADHTHDTYTTFAQYYYPGSTWLAAQSKYIDGWNWHFGQHIVPTGSQLFVFPKEGLWEVCGCGFLQAPAAINSIANPWMTVRLDFNNVTYAPYVISQGIATPHVKHVFNFSWKFPVFSNSPTNNLQVLVDNYTGQNVTIAFDYFSLNRVASIYAIL